MRTSPVLHRKIPLLLRRRLELFFEADLSAIRICEDDLAQSAGALAVASGNSIHIRRGLGDLLFAGLQRVLVHEIAHCLQQRGRRTSDLPGEVTIVDRPDLESEADTAAVEFLRARGRFTVAPREFPQHGAVLQCIDTKILRDWLTPAEYEMLKTALGGAFSLVLATDQETIGRFIVPNNGAASRTALSTFFDRIRGMTPLDAGRLCGFLSALRGAQYGELAQGLSGLTGADILQFVQGQQPASAGHLHSIVRRLQPLTGAQIVQLVQGLRNNRQFSVLQIYLLCSHLDPINGTAIRAFLTTYTLVDAQPMLAVLNRCRMGAPCLTGPQLNDIVLAVGGLPGIAGGFAIHAVLRDLYGPLGPARMHAIAQLSPRCLDRLERMLNGHMTAEELTTVLQHALFVNSNPQLVGLLQAMADANFVPADWAWLLKVISGQAQPVLPADTIVRKAALFFRHHCGVRASDVAVGDDTTVEQTTDNNPHGIRTFRDGSWKNVNKVHVRLSQRGANHFQRRHFIEHFNFGQIEDQNTFFPPGTDITTNQLFLVAAGTIEQLRDTDIANGWATHNVVVHQITYRSGVFWTAIPNQEMRAQPIARFDQFFIINAPANQVISIPRAELNIIDALLTAAGKLV